MPEHFANLAKSTLVETISNTATTLQVASTAHFPIAEVPPGEFRINVGVGNNQEIMMVTEVSGTTFTVIRGIEGTTPIEHKAGVPVAHVVTLEGLEKLIRTVAEAKALAEEVLGKATGSTIPSIAELESLESLLETLGFGIVIYGEDPTVARPTEGFAHYLWIGKESVEPEHRIRYGENPANVDFKLGFAVWPP